MKRIFFFNGKEVCGVNQRKLANYDLILKNLILIFAFIFFKDPQQCNHPPIYGGHVPSV